MMQPIDPERLQQIIPIMTTEHFTLQTGRGNTIAEANGRVTIFMSTVSSTLIALAFIGQISRRGSAFHVFSMVLLPSLVCLGVFTFDRVMQSGIEDAVYTRGINRVRHFYVEVAPEIGPYFVLPTYDDSPGTMLAMGIVSSTAQRIAQSFLSAAGMVAVVNSIIAGVFAGLALWTPFSTPLSVSTIVGVSVFVLTVTLHEVYHRRLWAGIAPQRGRAVSHSLC